MILRLWLNIGVLFALLILAMRMIYLEDSYIKIEEVNTAEKAYSDRLADIQYTAENRLANFKSFGLDEQAAAKAVTAAKKLDRKYRKQILNRLYATEDEAVASSLKNVFCRHSTDLRPRYAAVKFLLTEQKDKQRNVISLAKTSTLIEYEWSQKLVLDELYQNLEFVADRKLDSTVMYSAALLAGKEDELLGRIKPWGTGSSWSWSEVKEENKNIERKVIAYLAMMHVFTEISSSPKGICK